ncbi:MAG: ThuA domain-containing protein [Nibricoccus sp.]
MLRQPIFQLFILLALFSGGLSVPGHAAKDPLPPLAADAGRIIVYRDALMSPKTQPIVLLDGSETQPIKTRTYFQIDRPPGTYSLSLSGEATAPLSITLLAGQTLYVCVNVHNSAGGTELYPKLVDKTTALRELASCKYAARENAEAAADTQKPLRVLLTFKGHNFEEEKFFSMWDAWQKQGLLSYTRCPLPDDAAVLQPSATANFDVIVMYDMVAELPPERQHSLVALLQSGIGVVSLHHNLAAHEKWPLWSEIIGGKFLHGPETIGGRTYEKSIYEHDVWMKIGVPDPRHPITRGVEPFYIFDETYGKTYRAPDIQPVLTTDRAGNEREIAWTKWFGNSPIFYFQLGHDSRAWMHPLYQKILLQGMRWAAEEAAKRRETASATPR